MSTPSTHSSLLGNSLNKKNRSREVRKVVLKSFFRKTQGLCRDTSEATYGGISYHAFEVLRLHSHILVSFLLDIAMKKQAVPKYGAWVQGQKDR